MRKFLALLQKRIKHWIKPAPPALISGLLSDLIHSRTDLVVENALLRQQLIVLKRHVKRPRLTDSDRFSLVLLSHFTRFWRQSLHIAITLTGFQKLVGLFDLDGFDGISWQFGRLDPADRVLPASRHNLFLLNPIQHGP